MIKIIRGEIIEEAKSGKYTIVAQPCNCQNVMGAGVAKLFRQTWPECYVVDVEHGKGESKLGDLSVVEVEESMLIVNLYPQLYYGDKHKPDIVPFKKALRNLSGVATKQDKILMPRLGAERGKMNWLEVEDVIIDILDGYDVTIVAYDKKGLVNERTRFEDLA